MAEKRLYYVRKWLNKAHHESFGSVIAEVVLDTWTDDKKKGSVQTDLSGDFSLADCSRNVSLNFSAYGPHRKAQARNVRYKARIFRAVVNDFCDAIERGCDIIEGKVDG